jgi:hypothetical protein
LRTQPITLAILGGSAASNASFGTSGSNGGVVIGTSYAGTDNAPTNGLLVQGNVGIGTTSPQAQLEVVSTSNSLNRGIFSDEYLTGVSAALLSLNKADGTVASPTAVLSGQYGGSVNYNAYDGSNYLISAGVLSRINGTVSSGSVPQDLLFYTTGGANDTDPYTNGHVRMTISSGGKVGIGSTSPVVSLDLSKETDALALPVGTTGTRPTGAALTAGEIRYNTTTPAVEAYVNGAWTSLSGGSSITGSGTTNYVARWTGSTALGTGVLYDNGTNVGIGTTSPAGTLDVEGGTAAASTNGTSINVVAQSAGTGNKNGGNIILTPGAATGTGTPGNVGIGTTSPASLLDIGSTGTTLGTVQLEGSTSGYTKIQPAAAAGSWTMTLPSSAGANGDILQTNGSGVTSWQPQAASGSDILIQTITASNNASIAFTSIPSTYNQYEIRLSNVIPATNGDNLHLRVSEDNGSTWKSGGSAYWGSVGGTGSSIYISPTNVYNAANAGGMNGKIAVYTLGNSVTAKVFNYLMSAADNNAGATQTPSTGSGEYTADNNAVNALQFYFASGNITSGQFSLYCITN